jgi:DNA-directed RNA polymerase subunit RPC12/RpoP
VETPTLRSGASFASLISGHFVPSPLETTLDALVKLMTELADIQNSHKKYVYIRMVLGLIGIALIPILVVVLMMYGPWSYVTVICILVALFCIREFLTIKILSNVDCPKCGKPLVYRRKNVSSDDSSSDKSGIDYFRRDECSKNLYVDDWKIYGMP